YKSRASKVELPTDVQGRRESGIVVDFNPARLLGLIVSDNDERQQMIKVHMDECHMFGKRALRRFSKVEFNVETKSPQIGVCATHVTAPGQHVLNYHFANHFVPLHQRTQVLDATDTTKRYLGVIDSVKTLSTDRTLLYRILPVTAGFAPVVVDARDIHTTRWGLMRFGDLVEFSVHPKQKDMPQRGFNVTAPQGRTIVIEREKHGFYLWKRSHLKRTECPLTLDGQLATGWVALFRPNEGVGVIEVEAPRDKLYFQILFKAKDIVPGDFLERLIHRKGRSYYVQFQVAKSDDADQRVSTRQALHIQVQQYFDRFFCVIPSLIFFICIITQTKTFFFFPIIFNILQLKTDKNSYIHQNLLHCENTYKLTHNKNLFNFVIRLGKQEKNGKCSSSCSKVRLHLFTDTIAIQIILICCYFVCYSHPKQIKLNGTLDRHTFGLNSNFLGNILFLDETTLIYAAGRSIVFYNITEHSQRFISATQLCKDEDFSNFCTLLLNVQESPTKLVIKNFQKKKTKKQKKKRNLAVAERGQQPSITIYDTQALRKKKVISMPSTVRSKDIVSLSFSRNGWLAIQSGTPDWYLGVWQWDTNTSIQQVSYSKEVVHVLQ
ncbi:hypothetical protein RFI_17058, partial [Reticulomyxa filosa]